jgi:hypothetical protein
MTRPVTWSRAIRCTGIWAQEVDEGATRRIGHAIRQVSNKLTEVLAPFRILTEVVDDVPEELRHALAGVMLGIKHATKPVALAAITVWHTGIILPLAVLLARITRDLTS